MNGLVRFAGVLAFLASARVGAEDFVRVGRGAAGGWCFERGGERFHSMGVCHVTAIEKPRAEGGRFYDGEKARGGAAGWAASVRDRMADWGFNTAGAWCDEGVYSNAVWRTRYVWLSAEVGGVPQRLLNVFSEGYEARMDELCAEFVAPHKGEPNLIGWYLDNELPWYGEFGWPTDPHRSLLDLALQLPPQNPNRVEAHRFLREHYGDFAAFARQWETAADSWEALAAAGAPRAKTKLAGGAKDLWAGRVAERFFAVCAAAVRKHDPNHLVLGCRFAGDAPGPVLAACARHSDVISVNRYAKDGRADLAWWDRMYGIVQKPILITEFSWRATDNRSGNRNTLGADVTVPTQRDRAERYGGYVSALMSRPYVVGMHWFQWADEPEMGRALDGEDSNYGLVDWADRPYEELVAAARETHRGLASPDARRGPLPPPADPQGLAWTARPLAQLPGGALAAPVVLAAGEAAPEVSLDERGATRAAARREGDVWRIDFDTGTGWGFNVAWPPPQGKSLAGAGTLRIECESASKVKPFVIFFELGDHDPAHAPKGRADGECWMLGPVEPAGGRAVVTFDLREAELNLHHGNQHGNRRLDLDGLRAAGLYFPGNQGAGSFRVAGIVLAAP